MTTDLFGEPEKHSNRGSMTVTLNKEELAVLIDYGMRPNRSGGFQGLTKALYERVNKVTGELEITDELLGRSMRYMISYGRGGFQDSFLRPVFRRLLKL